MSGLGFKSVVFDGETRLGELHTFPVNDQNFQFPNNNIRIDHISQSSEGFHPFSVLQLVSSSLRCKLEPAPSGFDQSPLKELYASCFFEYKTAVVLLEEEEIHLVAMRSKHRKFPYFWCYSVPFGLYSACLQMLNLRCLSIVFDLDATLTVANTMESFNNTIAALMGCFSEDKGVIQLPGNRDEIVRYMVDRELLRQYKESDSVNVDGKIYEAQQEEEQQLSEGKERVVRPVIRLLEKNVILTRINPENRDTSVLVRLRPAWDELSTFLTAENLKRFEVYVCTVKKRDYALEIWRLLDPGSHLIYAKQLMDHIVCVNSGAKKSLLSVFQNGNCPKLAMVIDDRLEVWEDKDQPRIHVVPAFNPYSDPEEMDNAVPVLRVAGKVACGVRVRFFEEFGKCLDKKISEIFYEDEIVNLPSAPDVSNYLVSEDAVNVSSGNLNVSIHEGMYEPEVTQRLHQQEGQADMNSSPFMSNNPDMRPGSSQHTVGFAANVPVQLPILPSEKPSLVGPPFRNQGPVGSGMPISQVPKNTFRNSAAGHHSANGLEEDDDYSNSQGQTDQNGSGSSTRATGVVESTTGRKGGKRKRSQEARQVNTPEKEDFKRLLNPLLTSFDLVRLNERNKADGDKELVGRFLLVFDLYMRRMTQIYPGAVKRLDLSAYSLLKEVRTNRTKRIGSVPGIEVGDIFFSRTELCIVGLHALTISGIDYSSFKVTTKEESLAVNIVSSGGYNDSAGNGDQLVYTGQCKGKKDGEVLDQTLEKANLAMKNSFTHSKEVRVVRGEDYANTTGKIYVYDGLYKIEKLLEVNKAGLNVFRYTLRRVPGQPEAFKLWRSIEQWKMDMTSRDGVRILDLARGEERQPVCVVNNVDEEQGPANFTYVASLKYYRPFSTPRPSQGCHCDGGCQTGSNCPCIQRNGGFLPYSSVGVLLNYKTSIYECGSACLCPSGCQNRMSQRLAKFRFDVFKTEDRGWGLRSLNPIRGGSFICEYAGEVSHAGKNSDDDYCFDASRTFKPLEVVPDCNDKSQNVPFPLIISAKNRGNIARFMNHSCSPNVHWQFIVQEHANEESYHIAFFAIRHIPPLQELTYDYGMVKAGDHREKNCSCGMSNCRDDH